MTRTTRSIPKDWTAILTIQRAARQRIRDAERKLDAALSRAAVVRHLGGPGWPSKLGRANLTVESARSELVNATANLYLRS